MRLLGYFQIAIQILAFKKNSCSRVELIPDTSTLKKASAYYHPESSLKDNEPTQELCMCRL